MCDTKAGVIETPEENAMKSQLFLPGLSSMLLSPKRLSGCAEIFLFRISPFASTPRHMSLIFPLQIAFKREITIYHKLKQYSGRNHEKDDYHHSAACAMSL